MIGKSRDDRKDRQSVVPDNPRHREGFLTLLNVAMKTKLQPQPERKSGASNRGPKPAKAPR